MNIILKDYRKYLSDNRIEYINDSVEENFQILQQLDTTLQDPNIFKHAQEKSKKL